MESPQTRYTKRADGTYIAYQLFGSGDIDLVFARDSFNHLELQWEEPRYSGFLRRLGSFARVAILDTAGAGMSDAVSNAEPMLDLWADDTLAIMDVCGFERPALVTASAGATRGVMAVASRPDRVSAFVACDGFARLSTSVAPGELDGANWTGRFPTDEGVPERLRTWINRYRRLSATAGHAERILRFAQQIDVRHLLPTVGVPTLVIAHADNPTLPERAQEMADGIPGARLVELPGRTLAGWIYPDVDAVADEIRHFLTGAKGAPEPDRVLATVLFTDIVDSTAKANEIGDRRWRDLLDAHDEIVTGRVDRFGGHLVKSTGDGHLATFDAPGRAIRCACAIRDDVMRLDLSMRAGLHTGEVERRGDDLGGVALALARRVCDSAGAGEVRVSSAIPTLVAGSGLEFEELGEHEVKGMPGTWAIYNVKT
ncbi:MAG: adenylate/guanylate cyclase domain-containing protein [Actinomycetota bacterium]